MSFEVTTATPTSPPPSGGLIVGTGASPTFSPEVFNVADFACKLAGGYFPASAFGAADWTSGYAIVSAESGASTGRAFSGRFTHNSAGSAGLWRIEYTAARLHEFYFGGASVGTITSNGSATAYNTTSDYRLKEDEQPVADPVGRLMALRPVNFKWKAGDIRADGFMAHEVAAVVPDAVHGEKDATDPETGLIVAQGLDQSKLVPLLVAALQAALTRLAAIEAKLAD